MQIDTQTYLNQAARYEAQAAELPEGSPERESLLADARTLREDAARGSAPGLHIIGQPFKG